MRWWGVRTYSISLKLFIYLKNRSKKHKSKKESKEKKIENGTNENSTNNITENKDANKINTETEVFFL